MHYGKPLAVKVTSGKLVIDIGIHVLAHATAYADWANPFDEEHDDYLRDFAIIDPQELAEDVKNAMLREREDGSTPLSDFLDAMTQAAIDDGTLGIEYDQVIKHGTFSPLEKWADPTPPESD